MREEQREMLTSHMLQQEIDKLKNDNKDLARRCDNLMRIIAEKDAELDECRENESSDYLREENATVRDELDELLKGNHELRRVAEIMQRRLNNIAHELQATNEELVSQ